MYEIIDVSSWEKDINTGKGTKEKTMIVEPLTRRLVMFKQPAVGAGDIWSEKISCEIAKCIGFNVHEVDLAISNGIFGSIAYWFLEREERLLEGVDLIKSDGNEFNEWKRDGYNLQLIERILSCYNNELFKNFIEIVVFDILIGNTDRHSQNWGIIGSNDGKYVLAPAYDNSSSLGREFNSNLVKVNARLADHNLFMKYCHSNKGNYFIGWYDDYKIPHLDYAKLIYMEYTDIVKFHISKLIGLTDELILEIVNNIPELIMHISMKKFVVAFLIYRRDFLLKLIE